MRVVLDIREKKPIPETVSDGKPYFHTVKTVKVSFMGDREVVKFFCKLFNDKFLEERLDKEWEIK